MFEQKSITIIPMSGNKLEIEREDMVLVFKLLWDKMTPEQRVQTGFERSCNFKLDMPGYNLFPGKAGEICAQKLIAHINNSEILTSEVVIDATALDSKTLISAFYLDFFQTLFSYGYGFESIANLEWKFKFDFQYKTHQSILKVFEAEYTICHKHLQRLSWSPSGRFCCECVEYSDGECTV